MNGSVGQRAFQKARLKKKQRGETARLYERAVALVNSGALPDAGAVLRQLLQLSPGHFDALYLLGMTAYHTRSYHESEQLLAKAIAAEPRSADAHFNRGVVLTLLSRLEEARESYHRAIALKPQHANALYNLGFVCGMLNLPEEALANYEQAIAVRSDFAEAFYNRGLILAQLNRPSAAIESHDRALALKPRYAEALNGRGCALHNVGRSAEALKSYEEALAINPRFAQALNNSGIALAALGRLEEAMQNYDKAIALDPGLVDAHNNRGNLLRTLERHQEALASYDRALAINPSLLDAINGRGAALTQLRDLEQAMTCFAQVLAIQPDNADVLTNRAATLLQSWRLPEVITETDRALSLKPGLQLARLVRAYALINLSQVSLAIQEAESVLASSPDDHHAHTVLGICLAALGQIGEAIERFDTALAIRPDFGDAISAKIFTADFIDGADFKLHRDVRLGWWEHVGSKAAAKGGQPHHNSRDPQRRLVIGYVSSDFREHSAARVFKPVLQFADKAQFEIICYSCSVASDGVTDEFRSMADRWHDASQWDDDRLTDQIRADEVDILVDLSGHTRGNRLDVFARKPAPVQAHGWGHGMPPGLPTLDYVFSDPVAIPPDVRHLFVETICDVPCIVTLDPLPPNVQHAELPALTNGFVTFGVFNRINKISDVSAAAWAQILDRLPGSRLLIKHNALDDNMICENLLARLTRHGVPAERVELRGTTDRSLHLMAFNQVDIALDPFPQTGGVSTFEALQMGVPVVALAGNAYSSRLSASILSAVDMQDWVAEASDDYIEIAVRQASRLEALASFRRALPARLAATPAGNPQNYANEVGKAYRRMWQTYCAGQTRPSVD